jgi:membrane protease subunit HflK
MFDFLPKRGRPSNPKSNVNDPRWGHNRGDERKSNEGRRPNNNNDEDGPPELAELWRDFNQRLNRLMGKRGDGPYRPDSKGVKLTVAVVAAIGLLIWLASGAFIVQEGQVGVVTTFGKFDRLAAAGFNWSWPAPFEAHTIVDTTRTQTVEVGYRANLRDRRPAESMMPTADGNLVDVQASVQYRIKDPVAWVFNDRDRVETVRGAAETVVRQLVGASKLDALLFDSRDQLDRSAQAGVQQLADRYGLGAAILNVTIQQVSPPEQAAAAFEDVIKAREDAARERSEAQAFAGEILPRAKERAAIQLKNAETYRTNAINTATGNAARFDQVVAQYAKAPGVMRDRMYIETMQEILSSTSKVMIATKNGNNTLYLPLDGLLARSTANEAQIGSHSGVVQPAQAPQGQAPQPQAQVQAPAPADVPQSQSQLQPQPQSQPQPQMQMQNGESPRTRELRSREGGRERESR